MRRLHTAAGIAVASTILLGTALPAMAGTTDREIELNWPGVGGSFNLTDKDIAVGDEACDDDSVYAQWKTIPGNTIMIRNNDGCNGPWKHGSVPMGDGTWVYWRICVDKSWPTSDSCTGWDSGVVG
ncbi:hypothetical protein OG394_16200 [Kribbella sp. NBC_01245]|uniref:hypothetical protein n=1 Tax=Kribbella sp. NBC_01245 TaxID=2903578 RepID=UPI002E27CE89|nr:hypothetical protein [Kribbella sp. NBC_01245]